MVSIQYSIASSARQTPDLECHLSLRTPGMLSFLTYEVDEFNDSENLEVDS